MYINTHVSANVTAEILRCTRSATLFSGAYVFLLVQKGSVQLGVPQGSFILTQGHIALLPPDELSTLAPLAPGALIRLELDRGYIDNLIPPGGTLACNTAAAPHKGQESLAAILEELFSAYYEHDSERKVAGYLYLLSDHLKKHCLRAPEDMAGREARFAERLAEITALVHARYHQSLSLGDLAQQMYLSPQYLSKFIKKNLGVSFSKYLTDVRLQHARTELLQTDHPITGIALNNGFPNVTAFNKAFREAFASSPSAYKAARTAAAAPANQEALAPAASGRSTVTAELRADAVTPYHAAWSDTVNIGSLSHVLGMEFQEYFTQFHRTTAVRYARCENIFSPALIRYHEAEDRLDCSRFLEAIAFLHQHHIFPFILLSYRKEVYHSPFLPMRREKQVEFIPEEAYCLRVLEYILPYCINLYGQEYVGRWRFEITAAHDEYLRYTPSPHSFIQTYRHYYDCIKKLCPACPVGGPGFNMSGEPDIFKAYLSAFARERLRFDFLSLFSYPYETVAIPKSADPLSAGILSADPDHALHSFRRYREICVRSAFHGTALYITDFGSVLSSRNYIYDSVFQAAYLCKSFADFLGETPCVAYRGFWDSIPNISFSGAVYYSTCSLVSKNGIPKPSFHAYDLLSRLGKQLIAAGRNYIMTAGSRYQYQLLAFHYVHFDKKFRFGSWDRVPIEKTYEAFETAEDLSLSIRCTAVPPGRYKVTQLSLNRNHGSALDKYLRVLEGGTTTPAELLNTIMNFGDGEARYYRETAVPRRDIYYIGCEGALELDITLHPHEVQLYELTRIV